MDEGSDAPPVVVLPERFDRRLRLGPFPSARDALKFVCYAATGAVLAPFAAPYLWLPLVGIGFVVSAWRPDGRAIDVRALDYLAWRLRGTLREGPMSGPRRGPKVQGIWLQISPSRFVAVLRVPGVPFAYLPPAELARRFDLFRALLRTMQTSVVFLVGLEPIRYRDVRPAPDSAATLGRDAQRGYAELAQLLCRRRGRRRVYLALATTESRPEAMGELDRRMQQLEQQLRALELHPSRLTGRALRDAGRRYGWGPVGERP